MLFLSTGPYVVTVEVQMRSVVIADVHIVVVLCYIVLVLLLLSAVGFYFLVVLGENGHMQYKVDIFVFHFFTFSFVIDISI